MKTVLQKDTLTETYIDVQNLINKIVWKFCNEYGGVFEEYQAEANLSFILAYNTYNENKAQFSTWLYFYIRKRLLTYTKRLYEQWPYPNTMNEYTLEYIQNEKIYSSFSPMELLDEANEDVKLLINLIWEPPPEILDAKIKSGNHPCHIKIVLRNYLFKIGWTGRRIKESFEEIERILYA